MARSSLFLPLCSPPSLDELFPQKCCATLTKLHNYTITYFGGPPCRPTPLASAICERYLRALFASAICERRLRAPFASAVCERRLRAPFPAARLSFRTQPVIYL